MKSWVAAAYCLSVLLVSCFGTLACGTSGQLYVTKALNTQLDPSQTATVVTGGNGVKASLAAKKFGDLLSSKLEQRGIFAKLGPDGDVEIRAIIQNLDEGKTVGRGLSLKGKAKVTVEVKMTKPNGTLLCHITASADSQRENDEDRPALRVLDQAAEQIVEYLAEHAPKAKKK